jgi:hypothetical protein
MTLSSFPRTDTYGYVHHIRFIDNIVPDWWPRDGSRQRVRRGFIGGGDHLIRGNTFYKIGIGTRLWPGMNTIYNPGNRTIVERNVFQIARMVCRSA